MDRVWNYIGGFGRSIVRGSGDDFAKKGTCSITFGDSTDAESLLKMTFVNLIENACQFPADHHAKIKRYAEENQAIITF